MGGVLVAIFAIILLFGGVTGTISDGVDGLRTDPTTEAFAVVTGAAASSANVTLTKDPFKDDLTNITSITSNATETPIATTYTTGTNVLLVTNLAAGTSRTLTVNFDYETTDTLWSTLGPFLMLIIVGLIFAMIIWPLMSKKKNRY